MTDNNSEFSSMTTEERTEEVKMFFEDSGKPFTTAPNVADHFGTDRSTAYRALEELMKDGYFEKERIGGSAVVYYQ